MIIASSTLFLVLFLFAARRYVGGVHHKVELSERLLSERTEELVELERAFEVKWDEIQVGMGPVVVSLSLSCHVDGTACQAH